MKGKSVEELHELNQRGLVRRNASSPSSWRRRNDHPSKPCGRSSGAVTDDRLRTETQLKGNYNG
jgi:hypothetical protein